MTARSAADIRGFELDWLAVDGDDHVALFSTAGGGYVPEEVLRDIEAQGAAIDAILAASVTTRPRFAADEAGSGSTWRDMATRGIFAFDASFHGGPYRQIAAPWVPACVRALPAAASAIAGQVVFPDLRFADSDAIPEALLLHREMPVLRPSVIDLTAKLRAAKGAGRWSDLRFAALGLWAADVLCNGQWDWDGAAGEDWGAVLDCHGRLAVRLWRPGRFAFVHRRDGVRVLDDLRGRGVACEIVDSWDLQAYAISRDHLGELFDTWGPEVDPDAVSANELWWASV